MLVHLELHGLLLLLYHDRHDLVLEAAGLDGGQSLHLGVVAELVQLFPGDAPDVADVLSGGTHVIVVVSVPQAVLDHGVDDLGVAHPGAPTVGGDGIGSAAHALGAAAHHQDGVAALDGGGTLDDGLQAGAADHADGVGGHLQGHTGLDHALTGHVLALSGGQDVAEHNLVQPFALDVAALEGLGNDGGAQVSGGDIPQGAAEGADSSTAGTDDIYVSHDRSYLQKSLTGMHKAYIYRNIILAVPAKINCIFENFRGISKFFGGPAGYSAESGKRASKAWRIWLSPTMT